MEESCSAIAMTMCLVWTKRINNIFLLDRQKAGGGFRYGDGGNPTSVGWITVEILFSSHNVNILLSVWLIIICSLCRLEAENEEKVGPIPRMNFARIPVRQRWILQRYCRIPLWKMLQQLIGSYPLTGTGQWVKSLHTERRDLTCYCSRGRNLPSRPVDHESWWKHGLLYIAHDIIGPVTRPHAFGYQVPNIPPKTCMKPFL